VKLPIGRVAFASLLALLGCSRAAPPSQFPTARAAIERMRETTACSRGISGEATLDYFGDEGRVRVNSLYVVARPERIRFDVFNPLGGVLSTLTSDGQHFALLDVRQKLFLTGAASECNIERALRVPIPPPALGQLLTGQAPILVHQPGQAQLSWDAGSYRIAIQGEHDAVEELRLVPHESDWLKPWAEQRVRVQWVRVSQKGLVLYEVDMDEHKAASIAPPRKDAEGIEADVPPSGPACNAEVPRRVRFRVPGAGTDLIVLQKMVQHNPPLVRGIFQQEAPGGVRRELSSCPSGGLEQTPAPPE
jgi:hypothetical protein